MKISRRSAAALLGALPFAGKGASEVLAKQHASLGQMGVGSIGAAQGGAMNVAQQMPEGPRMPEWRAAQLAFANPEMKALARSLAFSRHRAIGAVDPDIEVYRSFSPMAKITFQRQRNVERDVLAVCTEPDWDRGSLLKNMIQKFMWGS